MSDPHIDSVERRKYYRINDVVLLRYEIIPEAPAGEQPTEDTGGLEISTGSLLAELDRELNKSINAVWRDHPLVAQTLGLLNRKISVVAAQSLDYEEASVHSYDNSMVNLSGCGIAFEGRQELAPGTRLQLSIILKPSQVTLSIAGTVVSSEQRLDSAIMPYWIRVDFDDDMLAQEQLIQHVVQKQGALLSDTPTAENDR
ncbi:PilZ domain-containing protein [Congregibacter variabilis]|uniref:PilZ domain-containing protein n=1 Tax=Congregibacter variabilis TaxID=3081200 RepID=A0ABZ0I3G8_9GAMM|nr:PilZ domain-containing protein [Congregibacter sp. IMCC43200]